MQGGSGQLIKWCGRGRDGTLWGCWQQGGMRQLGEGTGLDQVGGEGQGGEVPGVGRRWPLTWSVAVLSPLPRSHSLAVLSALPVASCRPSGLKATPVTVSVCPCVAAVGAASSAGQCSQESG